MLRIARVRGYQFRVFGTVMSMSHSLCTTAELRQMTREQLLAYVIRHASANPASTSGKRDDRPLPGATTVPASAAGNGEEGKSKLSLLATAAAEHSGSEEAHACESVAKKRGRREFDMGRYGQRLIALKLNYEGWRFRGFAAQGTSEHDTVEGHLLTALERTRLIVSRDMCDYSRAGRTDVGVSASGQVIGVRVRSAVVPPSSGARELDYVKTVNSALPLGIRVSSWSPVCDGTAPLPHIYDGDPPVIRAYWARLTASLEAIDTDANTGTEIEERGREHMRVRRPGQKFSARFDAASRTYKYFFARSALNLDAMSEAAALFEGRHDFRNFCRIDPDVRNFERLLYSVQIRRSHDDAVVSTSSGSNTDSSNQVKDGEDNEFTMYYVLVRGQAFLWRQVRCMVAVLFDVGRGREMPGVVRELLDDASSGRGVFANGRPNYRPAPPTPLVLCECAYPPSVAWFGAIDISAGVDMVKSLQKTKPTRSLSSFERVDALVAQSWAMYAAQGAVTREMMRDHERMVATASAGASINASADGDGNGDSISNEHHARPALRRALMIDAENGRHIAYHAQALVHDDLVAVKRGRTVASSSAGTGASLHTSRV